jgi:hypothetical protein
MAIYVYKNNEQLGPYEDSSVAESLRNGYFSSDDMACYAGSTSWVPLGSLFPQETAAQQSYQQQQPSHSWMQDAQGSAGAQPRQEQMRPAVNYAALAYQPPVPSQPVHHLVVHQTVNPYQTQGGSSLPTVAMSMGIVSMCLMLLGLVPCLGWINWMMLLVAGVNKILCWVCIFTEKRPDARSKAVVGLVLTFVALFIGVIRLILGGGCL